MEKELQLIEHLYDEPSEGTLPLRELLQDPDLTSEYQTLSRAKFALDHRPRSRPAASVVNALVRRAAVPAAHTAGRDRPALRLLPLHRRALVASFAVAAAVVFALLVQPWTLWTGGTSTSPAVASQPLETEMPADVLLRTLPPAATPSSFGAESGLPEWDPGVDIRTLSRRIQALQAAGIDAWDEPAVPLELLPSGSSAGFRTTGANRR